MKAGTRGNSGASLIAMVVLLLQMSLLTLWALNNNQQQLQALAALDGKALQRSLQMRQLFDELAEQTIVLGASATQVSGQHDLPGTSLQYEVLPVTCQHLAPGQTSGTACWSIEIHEQPSGFSRQRRLHVAEGTCGAYWYVAEAE
ncbi:hypothetical protein CWE09_06595 [Aliidiomarina minuta]|uniref:Uncharacterized protein n=1 Tax=Aliidiomarina minuta TaxID=880057 RepID=A0A432W8I2_9GAMM|nr:hypothetical protein [Aliidiomarina minuta]RUO26372.1 hypothetical protein CWE09_06595 [Aliidiomarina minuta]